MQLLFDFFPLVAFFVAYRLADIYVATGVIIVASVIQVSAHWLWKRRVSRMHLVSAGLVLLFGGLTLLIHDKSYIMWKPTVLSWLFAAALLLSLWRRVSDRPLIQRMFSAASEEISLSQSQWRLLNWTWTLFFLLMGAVNILVFENFAESTWVTFKVWGFIGLTCALAVGQAFWIVSRMHGHDSPAS